MASGNSDNFLIATYLSAKCPVYFAPAMDLDMYKHPTTKNALDKLQSYGNILIPSAFGELASGLVGMGRMAEPETIVETIEQHLLEGLPLYGKKILVTAGPTHEAIDPVRYIGNHSSGRMGFEIANTAAQLGAEVILISGPTHYKALYDSIQTIPITSARDMYDAAHQYFKGVDAAILSAAVADYRPKFPAVSKLKKKSSSLVLELEKTEDVLASLGEIKEKQLLIGFALETENEVANAIKKLKAKNLDLIILNSLNDDGAGFGGSTNKISIIDKDLNQTNYPLKSKSEVADDIINELIKRVHA
jgi:phosphopantothenoylcysteine decarboxylase/phosphopantothenate--cysteine ligase